MLVVLQLVDIRPAWPGYRKLPTCGNREIKWLSGEANGERQDRETGDLLGVYDGQESIRPNNTLQMPSKVPVSLLTYDPTSRQSGPKARHKTDNQTNNTSPRTVDVSQADSMQIDTETIPWVLRHPWLRSIHTPCRVS